MSYVSNIINAIAAEAEKHPVDSVLVPAKQKRLARLVSCLERAVPTNTPVTDVALASISDEVPDHESYALLSIAALRDEDGGWSWNGVRRVDDNIIIGDDMYDNSRKLLQWMRDGGWLSEESKGRIKVDFNDSIIEIKNKNTGEPIFALSSVH